MSTLLISFAGLPAFGRVHFGKFYFWEGLADASGTYLPGPTDPGVEVWFFNAPVPPLLKPKVYRGYFGTSGLSFGKYCGPGVCSNVFSCIRGSVPILGALTLGFLDKSALMGSSKNAAFS